MLLSTEHTIVSIVTYRRPEWAVEIVRRCLLEPDAHVWLTVNCEEFTSDHESRCTTPETAHRLRVWRSKRNLGAGGGRNLHLRERPACVSFFRLDDDCAIQRPGWLARAREVMEWNRAALVRISNDVAPGVFAPRHPYATGHFLVSGDCADALGGFYLGYGWTVLDEIEYSVRVRLWAERQPGRRGLIEFGESYVDLSETVDGSVGGGWITPWGLFDKRVEALTAGAAPLFVEYDPPQEPGWEQRAAGITTDEREFEW